MLQAITGVFSKRFFKLNSFWLCLIVSLGVSSFYILSRPEIGLLPTINTLELLEVKTLDWRF